MPMRAVRIFRGAILALILYSVFCIIAGIFVADGSLRPARHPLTEDEIAAMRTAAQALDAQLADVSITTAEGVTLSAWSLHQHHGSGNEVILLHGVGDNRVGMTGYAQLLLAHGYNVLMPDARGHGASGGELVTYGLLERNDIRQWFNFAQSEDHPHCIFGFGESMGAAQLLQSLGTGLRFCAVVVESPFATFREIAYDRMGQPFHLGPWVGRTFFWPVVEFGFLRARWKYGFDMWQISPENAVAEAVVPVLLIHGQVDSNIPVRHSRLIHAKAPATRLWEVPGADHCGAISVAPVEFQQKLLSFFESHSEPASQIAIGR
jgi:uncharacterized protein